jgi:hypothetical protein
VLELVATLPANRPYVVATDNFFSSLPLFRELRAQNRSAVGTVRGNRVGLSGNVNDAKLTIRGDKAWRYTEDGILHLKLRDTKDVCFLSTHHNVQDQGAIRRRDPVDKRKRVDVPVPLVVSSYQTSMQCSDRANQNCRQLAWPHSVRRWWLVSFYSLTTASLHNAHTMMRVTQSDKGVPHGQLITMKDFTLSICRAWLRRPQVPSMPAAKVHALLRGQKQGPQCACGCGNRPSYKCEACDVYVFPECSHKIHKVSAKIS